MDSQLVHLETTIISCITSQELNQRQNKMKLAGHMLRRNDDKIAKQALQWTLYRHREEDDREILEIKDLEKEMWTTGYKYNWRKMKETT